VMKAWKQHDWSWDFDGLSVHWYTTPGGWPLSMPSTGFNVDDYDKTLKSTLFMDLFLHKQEEVMDRYDPEKKIALVVDEWGGWYKALPGTNEHFLLQQNSLRDAILASLNLNIFARHADRVRMANIAQMINVIQAMILTDKEKMVLTPTYYVFKMYVPFQDATFVPINIDPGIVQRDGITLPRVDATVSYTHLDVYKRQIFTGHIDLFDVFLCHGHDARCLGNSSDRSAIGRICACRRKTQSLSIDDQLCYRTPAGAVGCSAI